MTSKTERYEKMKEIRDELLVFKQSPIYTYRTQNKYFPVVGEGNHEAKILFVGEAPGKNEAEKARPFCGASGKFLDELIASIGLKREDVYITNVVKDRPPENRDPTPEEIALYSPFLDRQIDIIQPKVIATLGRFSMTYIMNKFDLGLELGSISKIHGKEFHATAPFGDLTIVPLYHPAVALYDGSKRAELLKDFEILKKVRLTFFCALIPFHAEACMPEMIRFSIGEHIKEQWTLRHHDLHEIPTLFHRGCRFFRNFMLNKTGGGSLFPLDVSLETCTKPEIIPIIFTGRIYQKEESFGFSATVAKPESDDADVVFRREPS